MLELAGVAVTADPGTFLTKTIVTVAYLPPFLWLLTAALGGGRRRGAWWCVAWIGLVLVVEVLLHRGQMILPVFPALAVSVIVLVRPGRAIPVVVLLAAVTAPLALVAGAPLIELLYPRELLWQATLVALVGAARQLGRARRELADEALVRERLRIDDVLRSTVEPALAELVGRAEHACGAVRAGAEDADGEIAGLVAAARGTLADARRLARGFVRPTLRAELETAARLLSATGREVRAVPPSVELPPPVEEALRADLQAVVMSLLRQKDPGGLVVLRVALGPTGEYRLVAGHVGADGPSQRRPVGALR
ncbi:hypothetical protein [Blastococcus aurantiacus]|uniref:hypothetical protein n=1 Tax=Blastococcus aurantiacus TaxID=1550231 RepID=UPI00115FAAED|nr:hypothetical protein [Blastococcus aurantiacus]